MRYASFDCATKTLGCIIFDYDDGKLGTIFTGVDNLIPDKKNKDISLIERVKAVRRYVIKIRPFLTKDTTVILEYQMARNVAASAVCVALAALLGRYKIILIHPCYKNCLCFVSGNTIEEVRKQYKTREKANKAQSIANYKWLASEFDIKEPPSEHIADAFLQALAYISFSDVISESNFCKAKPKSASLNNRIKIGSAIRRQDSAKITL